VSWTTLHTPENELTLPGLTGHEPIDLGNGDDEEPDGDEQALA